MMLKIGRKIVNIIKNKYKLEGEVYISQVEGINIEIADHKCEEFSILQDYGIGLRILKEQRWGLAYTTDLNQDWDEIIKKAIYNADHNISDTYNIIPKFSNIKCEESSLNIFDQNLSKILTPEKMSLAQEMEQLALKYDPRIKKVLRAGYADSINQQTIVNSCGVEVSWQETQVSIGVEVKAEQNHQVQLGGEGEIKRFYQDLDYKNIVDKACFKAVKMLNAKPITTRKVPIVFDPYVSCEFLQLVASGICADSIQRGKSLFIDKKYTKVGSDLVTIIDDGLLVKGIGSAPYDDEGTPTQRTVIIKNGVLENFLYDTYTANKDKVTSTGNGSRVSFMKLPSVGVSNFYWQEGNCSTEQLLKSIEEGLYIIEVMGMHTTNPISGDFSVGVGGWWIEKGELTFPVQQVALAGNILELLQNVEMVADNLKFYANIGSPTIKIKQMTVSGE